MKVYIAEIKEKSAWEKFNTSLQFPAFFQSWDWGEVQKSEGVEVLRFGLFEEKKHVGIFQVFNRLARRGHFLHLRHGPVIPSWKREWMGKIVSFLKDLAKTKNASFIRISPLIPYTSEGFLILKNLSFRDAPIHNVDAENRWVLGLAGSVDTIKKNMRKTTRYLIRKAQASDIEIECSTKERDLKEFLRAYKETADLKHFIPHVSIVEEFRQFSEQKKAWIYFARQNKKLLSSAIIIQYAREAMYRHGATTQLGRKTPASYLLQWRAICDAKKRGAAYYNFLGVASDNNPKNPWYGLSQFKKGFGGEQVNFIHAMDLPVSPKYWLSFAIDYLTTKRKGY